MHTYLEKITLIIHIFSDMCTFQQLTRNDTLCSFIFLTKILFYILEDITLHSFYI